MSKKTGSDSALLVTLIAAPILSLFLGNDLGYQTRFIEDTDNGLTYIVNGATKITRQASPNTGQAGCRGRRRDPLKIGVSDY